MGFAGARLAQAGDLRRAYAYRQGKGAFLAKGLVAIEIQYHRRCLAASFLPTYVHTYLPGQTDTSDMMGAVSTVGQAGGRLKRPGLRWDWEARPAFPAHGRFSQTQAGS